MGKSGSSKKKSGNVDESTFELLAERQKVWGTAFSVARGEVAEWFNFKYDIAIFLHVESGRVDIKSDQRKEAFVLSPGMSIYVPHDRPISSKNHASTKGWFIAIPKKHAKGLSADIHVPESTSLLRALGAQILEVALDSDQTDRDRAIVRAFVHELAQLKPLASDPLRYPKSSNLLEVAEQIVERPHDPHSIDRWAKAAGMSRRSFTRAFQKETGLSFMNWIRQLRFQNALELLREGKPVAEVAYSLGYRSPSAFITRFKSKYGTSPLTYVKTHILKKSKS